MSARRNPLHEDSSENVRKLWDVSALINVENRYGLEIWANLHASFEIICASFPKVTLVCVKKKGGQHPLDSHAGRRIDFAIKNWQDFLGTF